jgi:crotonobetainyl-CoA:carnitine CoA-transferase CaiB-like acyl-CoA transferase
MIQASAGLMSITGPPGDDGAGPQKVGVAVADIMAGMYASTAVLAALSARERTGEGQFIDVPLYDSQVAWLANQNMNYLVAGKIPGRMGTGHPNLVPYQVFATADGNLMLAVGNDRQFADCVACLGEPEMAADPRFSRNSARITNREALVELLQTAFLKQSTGYWLSELLERGVPAGPVNDIREVLENDYAKERQLVRYVETATGDAVPTVANPVDFSLTPVRYSSAPPRLGEHTNEVLQEWLGYSDELIAELREHRVI